MTTDLVVLVLGVMGSTLANADGKEVWGVGARGISDALRTLGGSIRDLTLPIEQGDGPAPEAVAVVCYVSADRDEDRATAVAHIAIGLAMQDQPDAAIAVVRDARRAHDVSSLVRYVTDAISQRPQHAVNLASLIRNLTEPEPPASD